MFKLLILLLGATLLCGPATAVIDEDENVIGLYFDTDADSDCLEAVNPHSQIPCYIILTNPSFSELYGFELGFDYGGELLHLGTTLAMSEAINVGSDDNLIVGFGSPTSTETATLLATLNMMYIDMSNTPTNLALRGSSPSSLDPAFPTVLLADGELVSTALHSSDFPYQMNGFCEFVDQSASFDGVKSMFR
jgi:hypothetical protein